MLIISHLFSAVISGRLSREKWRSSAPVCIQPLMETSDAPTPAMRRLNACEETTRRLWRDYSMLVIWSTDIELTVGELHCKADSGLPDKYTQLSVEYNKVSLFLCSQNVINSGKKWTSRGLGSHFTQQTVHHFISTIQRSVGNAHIYGCCPSSELAFTSRGPTGGWKLIWTTHDLSQIIFCPMVTSFSLNQPALSPNSQHRARSPAPLPLHHGSHFL
ncbi:hypothetical protein F2P79_004993 [Pimephales promelas]|nr:hypothetical protein F2P79_004993 [Pimephales promelas]